MAFGSNRIYSGKTVYTEKKLPTFTIEVKLHWNEHHSQFAEPKRATWLDLGSNIDIFTLVGLSYPPTAVSTFSSLCQGLVGTWKRAGQVKENCCWKQERNRKIKENAFNLSTITVLYQVQQNFECFFVSQGPAFIHSTARVAGSQQTLIAQRPKAATYKQGHSSSHGKGNGLWPWSLITPLLQCYKVIREALWQTPALTYMCGRGWSCDQR